MKILKTANHKKIAYDERYQEEMDKSFLDSFIFLDEEAGNKIIEDTKRQMFHDSILYDQVKDFAIKFLNEDNLSFEAGNLDFGEFFSVIKPNFVSLDDHDEDPNYVQKIEKITDKLWKEVINGTLGQGQLPDEQPIAGQMADDQASFDVERLSPNVAPNRHNTEPQDTL